MYCYYAKLPTDAMNAALCVYTVFRLPPSVMLVGSVMLATFAVVGS